MKTWLCPAVIFCGLLLLALPAARGDLVIFTLDPAQSRVTLSGTAAGATILEQGAGSLVTEFAGTILANVTASTIEFPGESKLDAAANGNWQPVPGGGPGSAPADYGGKAVSGLGFEVKGAFRNILLDVVSPVLPLSGGTFDASSLMFLFPTGSNASLDYDMIALQGSVPLTGLSGNRASAAATLTEEGGVRKLVIDVDTEYTFKALVNNDSTVRFTGKLVAIAGNRPVVGWASFAGGKLVLFVRGAKATTQIQSTVDFKTWQPRAAEQTTEADGVTFRIQAAGAVEFFRAVQP